jgi:hypothetical protein
MKSFFLIFRIAIILFIIFLPKFSKASIGFALPDSVNEFTVKYKSIDGLIILPVKLNDEHAVNLILDTGCSSILLFGKRFQYLFKGEPGRAIEFSGMGSGKTVHGNLSLTNNISIGLVEGKQVPIVVVPSRNIFHSYPGVDGLIGYDIFTKFEIEIQPAKQLITFRSAYTNYIPEGYTRIPMKVTDSKPILQSSIILPDRTVVSDLLIDTGSTLGLLLKSPNESKFEYDGKDVLGKGLNGSIKGMNSIAHKIQLENFVMNNIVTCIIHSPWRNYASIGMNTLKNYSIILNYAKSYACLKFTGES